MSLWIFSSLFFVLATTEDIVFNLNKVALSECIKDYLLNSDDQYYRETGIAEAIADRVAKRFYGKTKNIQRFYDSVNNLFYEIRRRKSHLFPNHEVHAALQFTIKEALIHCSTYNRTNQLAGSVPKFNREPPEIGALLDYILVDWPIPLQDMISTRNGRAVLRRYAEDAGVRLAIALNSVMDHEYFRYLLRSCWMSRAHYYFNGHDKEFPYLRYSYNLEHPYPHTCDNLSELRTRSTFYLIEYRNPHVSPEDFNRIMRIHIADRPGYGESDVYSMCEEAATMSSARYYIETHIDQFYRIIFFFMEMQIHGISIDAEDMYSGQLPKHKMPVRLQEILYNDYVYRNYLLSLRIFLGKTLTNNSRIKINVGNSLSSARVREEDLISLLSIWIKFKFDISTDDKFDNSTISVPIISTTPKYDQYKRNGSVLENDSFKYSCGDASSAKKQKHVDNNDKNYGYATHDDDISNLLDIPSGQQFLNLKIQDSFCLSSIEI